ncbi:uncharacterized protein LOC141595809 [Silene latifolia]|uniref:uncharacterized protein LOC141595809 n=1 Tax=Silene latifolia TaxID=37657 RepID=UPI003D76A9C1
MGSQLQQPARRWRLLAAGYQGASTSGAGASGAGGDEEMEEGPGRYLFRILWLRFGILGHALWYGNRDLLQRVSSWNGIFLSSAGRLTLISSVLSNLSNYFLSFFKIPVHDCIYWKHTTNGEYSVKSGYGVAFSHFMEKHASNKDKTRMSDNSIRFCQKVLWKLPVPQKWKVFLWRLISDSLPMGSSLAQRGFQADPSCKVCATEAGFMETRAHLFRDCSVAKRIWDIGLSTGSHIWVVRNRVVFQKATFHPQLFYGIWRSTVDIVVKAWEEGEKVRGADRVVGGDLNCSPIEPRDGHPFYVVGAAFSCASVKVMVDAGWKSVKEAAIGWVATADDGTILFSRSIKIKAQSALQAEALGLKDVLIWARDQGIRHLDVSTDCLKLLLQITGREMVHHLTRGILDDMGVLFPMFHCLSFTFVLRCFNKTAHDLVKKAMRGS